MLFDPSPFLEAPVTTFEDRKLELVLGGGGGVLLKV